MHRSSSKSPVTAEDLAHAAFGSHAAWETCFTAALDLDCALTELLDRLVWVLAAVTQARAVSLYRWADPPARIASTPGASARPHLELPAEQAGRLKGGELVTYDGDVFVPAVADGICRGVVGFEAPSTQGSATWQRIRAYGRQVARLLETSDPPSPSC